MATVHDVAAAVMERLGSTTAMKLEKLVYYCQCWHLARCGSVLFSEPIEAWREGPVVPALYKQHRRQYTVETWPHGSSANLTAEQTEVIAWVTEEYGSFSAIELSRMTHNELPWRAARVALPDSSPSSARINTEIMRNYYARQLTQPEAAVTLATANAALEGTEFDEEWQNELRDLATGLVSAEDLIARVISRVNGV